MPVQETLSFRSLLSVTAWTAQSFSVCDDFDRANERQLLSSTNSAYERLQRGPERKGKRADTLHENHSAYQGAENIKPNSRVFRSGTGVFSHSPIARRHTLQHPQHVNRAQITPVCWRAW